jgi:hypothetical protein
LRLATPALLALLVLGARLSAGADQGVVRGHAAIPEETHRTRKIGSHLLSFWWLPVEYWVGVAQELGKPPAEVDRVRELLRGYVVLGVVDAQVAPDGTVTFGALEDAKKRFVIVRDGRETPPAARPDPEIVRLMPELSYFMVASLGVMAPGLRLVLLPNVDDDGRPLLTGSTPGTLAARYRADGEAPIPLQWRAPLTAVVGSKRCPKGGEDLEASWSYCPWHGVPAD